MKHKKELYPQLEDPKSNQLEYVLPNNINDVNKNNNSVEKGDNNFSCNEMNNNENKNVIQIDFGGGINEKNNNEIIMNDINEETNKNNKNIGNFDSNNNNNSNNKKGTFEIEQNVKKINEIMKSTSSKNSKSQN